jgi:hypothetical protein
MINNYTNVDLSKIAVREEKRSREREDNQSLGTKELESQRSEANKITTDRVNVKA